MDKVFLQLLLQFVQALVDQRVGEGVNKGLQQGYVSLEPGKAISNVEQAKVALADHIGCDVCDLDAV